MMRNSTSRYCSKIISNWRCFCCSS